MFCDLIGSTALSSRLDAEDLREVIRAYQACVASTIQQFNGFIARYVGDGVLIYFGWPEATETDAERAVRAGLAVAADSRTTWPSPSFACDHRRSSRSSSSSRPTSGVAHYRRGLASKRLSVTKSRSTRQA